MKRCPDCGSHGPFTKDKRRSDGLGTYCRVCAHKRGTASRRRKRNEARLRELAEVLEFEPFETVALRISDLFGDYEGGYLDLPGLLCKVLVEFRETRCLPPDLRPLPRVELGDKGQTWRELLNKYGV